MPISKLSDQEVDTRLSTLPGWKRDNDAIARTFRTTSWKSTMMVVNAVGFLAEAAWHHPDLTVSFNAVTVRLSTHDAGGLSERDFALAARIDDLLDWRAPDGGVLEGTPADPRHALFKS
jgi:4a-hydroxytetrahydrobiopterin dehydratase